MAETSVGNMIVVGVACMMLAFVPKSANLEQSALVGVIVLIAKYTFLNQNFLDNGARLWPLND
jgi:hypothetical protein